MTAGPRSALRPWLAAILILALTVIGAGRGVVSVADLTGGGISIAGVSVPICHGSGSVPADPASPSNHDCCDACALLAAAALPASPIVPRPAPVAAFASHAFALAWAPHIARVWSPRLSQGPPDRVT